MPLISIYATVYNNAYIVEQSITSLIKALPNFEENYELVIIDNFSTDGTWENFKNSRDRIQTFGFTDIDAHEGLDEMLL